MFKLLKKILIKRWAREIHQSLGQKSITQSNVKNSCKNLAGLGGQQGISGSVSWSQLVKQQNNQSSLWASNRELGIKEQIFYEYFGPLEHWCDENCQHPYYLWSDESGIHRIFTHPYDDILWNLTFEKQMPSMEEIYQRIKIDS